MAAAPAWLHPHLPPLSHLRPDCLLADKDEEHEYPTEQVQDVDGEEEVVEDLIFKIRSVSDQDCMDSFKAPEEAENEEELCVESLSTIYYQAVIASFASLFNCLHTNWSNVSALILLVSDFFTVLALFEKTDILSDFLLKIKLYICKPQF